MTTINQYKIQLSPISNHCFVFLYDERVGVCQTVERANILIVTHRNESIKMRHYEMQRQIYT